MDRTDRMPSVEPASNPKPAVPKPVHKAKHQEHQKAPKQKTKSLSVDLDDIMDKMSKTFGIFIEFI